MPGGKGGTQIGIFNLGSPLEDENQWGKGQPTAW
jgi:hypothetical protein